MASGLENFPLLKKAERVGQEIWQATEGWQRFEREVIGSQMIRAADSIGANLAESYGRFHYGDKLQFLYYARGSLYETKFWLGRSHQRKLVSDEAHQALFRQLDALAKDLNGYINYMRNQRKNA